MTIFPVLVSDAPGLPAQIFLFASLGAAQAYAASIQRAHGTASNQVIFVITGGWTVTQVAATL
jgi:hypothetical protein